MERARAAREETLREMKEDSMNRLMKDLAVDRAKNPTGALNDRWDPTEDDEDEEEEEDGEDASMERGTIKTLSHAFFTSIT